MSAEMRSDGVVGNKWHKSVWFTDPKTGRQKRIRVVGWTFAGLLLGPFAMLFARLWLQAVACLIIQAIGNIAFASVFPGTPPYPIGLIGAIWGACTPKLLARKYERLGWIKS